MLLREAEMLDIKARLQRGMALGLLLRHDFSRAQTIGRVLSGRAAGEKAQWPQHLIVV